MANLFSVKDKVVVITGGTGVLGKAIAAHLAEEGAKVILLGRKTEVGNKIVESIRTQGGEALFLTTDVLDRKILEQNLADILKAYGRIDALLNAAGGNMPGATISPTGDIFDLKIDEFQKVLDLNLTGTILPTQVFLKFMATEIAKKFGEGIRINAIAPGFFLTEQNRALLTNPDGTYTQRGQDVIRQTPFGRMGRAEELCGTIQYLISDAASFVTGTVAVVDGGFNAFAM